MTSRPADSTRPVAAPSTEVRTRVVVGLILALLAAALLAGDHGIEAATGWKIYPCFLFCVLLLSTLATVELLELLADQPRPPAWLAVGGCCLLILAAWASLVRHDIFPQAPAWGLEHAFAAVVVLGFLYEMAVFHKPGHAVLRLGLLTWIVAYLGFLPTFLLVLRWHGGPGESSLAGVTALALVIFVPKCGDIGAFFAGRALGRHRMSPVLSPKKTWEGFAGGLLASVLVAVLLNRLMEPILHSDLRAAGFGVVIGIAGVLGDLAESLIKRDCGKKDAASHVPGFGGVLDVVDSILFAGPIACWWL